MMQPLTVLILAGGRSSRMGQDKSWLNLNGVPLVEHVARRMAPLAGEIVFSTNDPSPFAALIARLPVPAVVVADMVLDAGPLAGLHAGLHAARHHLIFALATDMPFVNHALVTAMIDLVADKDAVVPLLNIQNFTEPQAEPLHAVYRRTCLPAIEAALAKGRRRAVSFLDDVNVCYVEEAALRRIDPELRSFRNLNTPHEWAAAQASFRDTDANRTGLEPAE